MRVLIVDDEPSIIEVLSMALEAEGYEVAAAGGGLEGLAQLAARHIDAVLLDVMMPQMDGFETLARIRALPEHMDTPVVLMSAGTPDLARAPAPFDEYLPKPFSLPTVLASLEKAINAHRPPQFGP